MTNLSRTFQPCKRMRRRECQCWHDQHWWTFARCCLLVTCCCML